MRSLPSLLALAGIFCAFQADAADQRPNILLCVADDWGWPHAGAYGDKVVKTPHFEPKYAAAQKQLRTKLDQWMRETSDPRASSDDDPWDRYPYFAGAQRKNPAPPAPPR